MSATRATSAHKVNEGRKQRVRTQHRQRTRHISEFSNISILSATKLKSIRRSCDSEKFRVNFCDWSSLHLFRILVREILVTETIQINHRRFGRSFSPVPKRSLVCFFKCARRVNGMSKYRTTATIRLYFSDYFWVMKMRRKHLRGAQTHECGCLATNSVCVGHDALVLAHTNQRLV